MITVYKHLTGFKRVAISGPWCRARSNWLTLQTEILVQYPERPLNYKDWNAREIGCLRGLWNSFHWRFLRMLHKYLSIMACVCLIMPQSGIEPDYLLRSLPALRSYCSYELSVKYIIKDQDFQTCLSVQCDSFGGSNNGRSSSNNRTWWEFYHCESPDC